MVLSTEFAIDTFTVIALSLISALTKELIDPQRRDAWRTVDQVVHTIFAIMPDSAKKIIVRRTGKKK